MTTQATDILLPVGRLVMGSLYKAQDRDANGAPLTVKTGPNIGKPTVKYFFALAVPKIAGHTHWAQTDWGRKIWDIGHAAFPQGQASAPTFAWKVEDGDSTVPNKKGRKNADTEGMAGCWVVSLSSSFAPKIYNADGSAPLVDADAVKLGYFIEVLSSVSGNNNAQNPGVYINHRMVALRGYGPEITRGPDASAVGFGAGALPAGASSAPTGSVLPPVPAPGAPVTHVAALPGAAPPPVPTAVTPHPGFMVPPVPGVHTTAAPPPPAPPAAMVVAAGGYSWKGPPGTSQAMYAAGGWTIEQMRAQGLLG